MESNKKSWMVWVVAIVAVAVIVVVSLSSRRAPEVNSDPYKIGAALALSGDASSWGEVELNAIQLAVGEINDAGGVNGKNIEVVIEDTKSDSKGSVNALQKLLSVDNVDAIIGPTWFDSYPGGASMMKEYQDKILIVPSASIDVVNEGGQYPNVFSTFARPKIQAQLLGEYMKSLGNKKVAVVFQNDAYFQEFFINFKEGYNADQNIIASELVNYGDNIRTVLDKVSAQKPDILLFGLYDQQQLYELMKTKDIRFPEAQIFGNDNVENLLVYEGIVMENIKGISFITTKDPSDSFRKKYQDYYDEAPKYSASNAYDAVFMIKYFFEHDSDASSLRNHTFKTASFGNIQFDSIGGVGTELKPYCIKTINAETGNQDIVKCW